MSNVLCKTNQEIPQDMLLGNLLFTNLIDMQIADTDLSAIFQKNHIPERYVKKISPSDAFRRASASIKNRILYVTGNNGNDKVRVEIDEVKCDADSIKRIIGIKRVDEVNEDITYEPVGEIVFNRTGNVCVATPLMASGDANYQTFRDLCDEVENKYSNWSVYHNKDTIRNIINRIIADTHPVNLMPTGLCKFVPSSSTDLLYNLKAALEDISIYRAKSASNGDNIMEIIPVIDTEEQRALIEKNFTAEITEELFGFTQELKEVLSKKQTLSTRTATAYIEKFNILRNKAKEYESLLGIYVDSIYQQITDSLTLVDDSTEDTTE